MLTCRHDRLLVVVGIVEGLQVNVAERQQERVVEAHRCAVHRYGWELIGEVRLAGQRRRGERRQVVVALIPPEKSCRLVSS